MYKERYNDAKEAGEVENLTPQFVEFKKEGMVIVGKLLSIAEVKSALSADPYNQYIVDTDDGLVKFHLGAATDKEIKGVLKINGVYAFTYAGSEKISGGRTVNKFTVERLPMSAEDEEVIDTE